VSNAFPVPRLIPDPLQFPQTKSRILARPWFVTDTFGCLMLHHSPVVRGLQRFGNLDREVEELVVLRGLAVMRCLTVCPSKYGTSMKGLPSYSPITRSQCYIIHETQQSSPVTYVPARSPGHVVVY